MRWAGNSFLKDANNLMLKLSLPLMRYLGLVAITVLPLTVFAQSPSPDMYDQKLTLRFATAEAADQAQLQIESLFDGHYRAVSCRWDDNWTSDNLPTRDLMERYGIKGTWYLNERFFSPENRPADYLPVAKKLLAGDNSIGGHSLTHPFVTYYHNNRTFEEMSGVRIQWEADLDQPVVSYAYSFVDIRPEPEGAVVMKRTLDSLTRAGFDHVSEYVSFFEGIEYEQEISPIMPPENNPFDVFEKAVDWACNSEEVGRQYPMITNSMHAWYGTPRLNYEYDEFEKRLKLLSSLKDIWNCNQNQYSAYRHQVKHGSLAAVTREGQTVEVTLRRPRLLVLNDPMPLTLSIAAVARQDVKSVLVDGKPLELSKRSVDQRVLFHVPHTDPQGLPIKIGRVQNPDNSEQWNDLKPDADFPNLQAGLSVQNDRLKLRLACKESQRLADVRVTWRAPIGYEIQQMVQYPKLTDQGGLQLECPLVEASDPDSRWGREHFAAQVDFSLDGQRGRLHLTCQRPGKMPDDSLPINGFSLLGPFKPEQVSADQLVSLAKQQWQADQWQSDAWKVDGKQAVAWRPRAQDGYVTQRWMNPEYVRTTGSWDAYSPGYVLRAIVHSPEDRAARLTVSHPLDSRILIDGQEVKLGTVQLKKGDNHLMIVYPSATLGVKTQRLTACFVRLADPATNVRFDDIRYQPF